MGSINFEPHSCLCDSGSRSSRRNRGSLCASLGGGGGGGAGSRGSRSSSGGRLSRLLGSGLVVGAVPGDVTSLGTLVADLASRAQGATIGGGAVTRDVAKLAASVALHSLSLTVTGEVVRATALIASGSARITTVSATEATVISTTRGTDTAASARSRSRAVASKVAWLAAVVATAIRAIETQSGTVGLNVA